MRRIAQSTNKSADIAYGWKLDETRIRHYAARFPERCGIEPCCRIHTVAIGNPGQAVGRHLHRVPYWKRTLNQMGIRWILRSLADTRVPAGSVILWDTFGELSSAYRYAKTAFIGGSLAPLGGQNFLEALVNGVRPIIGPSWENFAWVGPQIIESGLLRVAGDWQEVTNLQLQDIDGLIDRQAVIAATQQYLKDRRGGTQKACRLIAAYLESDLRTG